MLPILQKILAVLWVLLKTSIFKFPNKTLAPNDIVPDTAKKNYIPYK